MYRQFKKRFQHKDKNMNKLRIGLVLSSTRDGRMADRVLQFVKKAVQKDHDVVVFDPKEIDLPPTQQSMNFMYNPSAIPKNILDLNEKFSKVDALVLLCAEYNWSVPPAIANLFDNIPPTTLNWKPCGIVTYSMATTGGARAGIQVRSLTGGVGLVCVPVQMTIPTVHETLDAEGESKNQQLHDQLGAVLQHVYFGASAIKSYSATTPPPKWTTS